ncbi:MAG: transglycosylase SLT domain-containing protein [Bacteroidales bacterium]|nr:transglycosylase SLT domain-containing protein [Bacteroidales bacterium]
MRTKPIERTAFATTLLLIAATVIFSPRRGCSDGAPLEFMREKGRPHLECVIDFGGPVHTSQGLVYGYTYWMFTEWSRSSRVPVRIRIASPRENYLDSLIEGSVDLVAIPCREALPPLEGLAATQPLDSLCTWYVRSGARMELRALNRWIAAQDFSGAHRKFMKVINPWKRQTVSAWLSPYDDQFREWGRRIGMDWRLLAAVGWQESHWRIDTKSRRGAQGIMQIMPVTARRYGIDDLTDPERNIEAGARLLEELHRSFGDLDFVLAAYNAGGSRVRSYIQYAARYGADVSRWEEVAGLLPQLGRDSLYLADTLGLKRIGYGETVQYVRRVKSIYREFRRICPMPDELSGQDPPAQ